MIYLYIWLIFALVNMIMMIVYDMIRNKNSPEAKALHRQPASLWVISAVVIIVCGPVGLCTTIVDIIKDRLK